MCRVSKPQTQSAVQFKNLSILKEVQRASPDTVSSTPLDLPKPELPPVSRTIAPPDHVHLEPRWHPLPASKRAFQTMAVEPLDPKSIRNIFRYVAKHGYEEETKSSSCTESEEENSGYRTPPMSPCASRRRLEPPSPPYPYRTLVEIHVSSEDLYLPFV